MTPDQFRAAGEFAQNRQRGNPGSPWESVAFAAAIVALGEYADRTGNQPAKIIVNTVTAIGLLFGLFILVVLGVAVFEYFNPPPLETFCVPLDTWTTVEECPGR